MLAGGQPHLAGFLDWADWDGDAGGEGAEAADGRQSHLWSELTRSLLTARLDTDAGAPVAAYVRLSTVDEAEVDAGSRQITLALDGGRAVVLTAPDDKSLAAWRGALRRALAEHRLDTARSVTPSPTRLVGRDPPRQASSGRSEAESSSTGPSRASSSAATSPPARSSAPRTHDGPSPHRHRHRHRRRHRRGTAAGGASTPRPVLMAPPLPAAPSSPPLCLAPPAECLTDAPLLTATPPRGHPITTWRVDAWRGRPAAGLRLRYGAGISPWRARVAAPHPEPDAISPLRALSVTSSSASGVSPAVRTRDRDPIGRRHSRSPFRGRSVSPGEKAKTRSRPLDRTDPLLCLCQPRRFMKHDAQGSACGHGLPVYTCLSLDGRHLVVIPADVLVRRLRKAGLLPNSDGAVRDVPVAIRSLDSAREFVGERHCVAMPVANIRAVQVGPVGGGRQRPRSKRNEALLCFLSRSHALMLETADPDEAVWLCERWNQLLRRQ